MGSIQIAPYHPLDRQPGPLQQLSQVLGVQQQQQQIAAGAQENQMRAQQINDQKAMTAAMHEWDGKDFDSLVPLASKHGASAQAVMGLKSKQLEIKDKYSQIAKNDAETGAKNLDSMKQKNDMVLGGINGLSDVSDEQLGQRVGATAQNLIQQGLIDPQHGQALMQIAQQDPKSIRTALPIFAKDYMGQSAQMQKAKDDADLAAKKAQLPGQQAESEIKQSEAAAMKQYGGLTGPAADAKYRFIVQKQKLGNPVNPEEQAFVGAYEKQKTLVPTANFNLQMSAGGKVTDGALDQAAERYFQTGQLPPSGGRGPAAMAQNKAIMNRAAELHAGESITEASANYAANKKSLEGLQKNFDQVSAFENTAKKNIDLLQDTAKKIPDLGSRFANIPVRAISASMIGTDNMAAFKTALNTAQTEAAKVLNSSNASGVLSDSARHELQQIIDGDMPYSAMVTSLSILKQDMQNRHDAYQDQITDIKGRMKTKPAGGSGGGQFSVTDPNGKVHPFKSQAEADAFKKAANIQ
jgi:hypothetical protein